MADIHQPRKRMILRGLGSDGEDMPSIGGLEGDLLRILWDANEPKSSVQLYEEVFFIRRSQKREMQSPSTIAVTLSHMVDKGLLSVERRSGGGKGYYAPIHPRGRVVASVLNDVSHRLVGQPLGHLLTRLRTTRERGTDNDDPNGDGIDDLLAELMDWEKTAK